MVDMNKMQGKVNKLMRVFTNLINELDKQITELKGEIRHNEEVIEKRKEDNIMYESKIKEYETLKTNVERIVM